MTNKLKMILPTLLLGTVLGLAGCNTTSSVTTPPDVDPDGCDLGSTSTEDLCRMDNARSVVKLPTSVSGPVGAALVNFHDFSVSLAGSTVVFPASGTFTLSLKNSAGQTVGASSFNWSKQGNALVPSTPASIQNWVASSNSSFKEVSVEIDPTMVGVQTGLNVIMLSPTMGQTILGASGTIWTMSDCQTGPFASPDVSLCL